MARIRTIKPEFPHAETMGRVSRNARLCFVLMWTIADDSGRLRGNSRMLASLLYPYDEDALIEIDSWIAELEAEGSLIRYCVEDALYIQISNWQKHQRIDHPTQSKLPPPEEISRGLARDSRGLQEPSRGTPLGREGKGPVPGEEGKGSGSSGAPAPLVPKKQSRKRKLTDLKPESVEAFEAIWEKAPVEVYCYDKESRGWATKPVSKGPKGDAERYFQQLVDAGAATPYELYAAYYAYIEQSPKVKEGWIQNVATFFGPKKKTYEDWIPAGRLLIEKEA